MNEDKALLTLLRAKSTYRTSGGTMAEWINPDGPLAADRIEALTAEVERLREECQAQYDRGYYEGRADMGEWE